MMMVLSENNEPFMKSSSSGSVPNPGTVENSDSPASVSNPGERLRSIEMASSLKVRKTLDLKFLQRFKDVKIQKEKLLPAFHNVSSTISITVNIILLAVILLLSQQVFALKKMIVGDVLGGLYLNFGEMDKASINTEIVVMDNILVDFPLQINQETEVVLTKDTVINGARVTISTGALNITNAPANIILPAGARLPIQLNMTVPVNASVPISLNVPVDIPLAETELHQPITNLQKVVQPYLYSFMDGPFTWQELPACKVIGFICNWWFK
jgi:hypothetical protein